MRFNLLKVYVRLIYNFEQLDLLEVVIQEAVEDGVGADRGDADEVEDHEEGHHVLRVIKQVRHFCYQTEKAEKYESWQHF